MSTYTCPTCGYRTAYGNPARIALHRRVSHSTGTQIVAIESTCQHSASTRTGTDADCAPIFHCDTCGDTWNEPLA